MATYPNAQNNPAGAIPVYITGGSGGGALPTGAVVGYQQIAPVAATPLTVPPTAKSAYVTVEAGNVRWRADGTDPTATVGQPLFGTSNLTLSSVAMMNAIKFIDMTGSAATVNVTYFG